jgi:catechol 2,3-dioxygenase-like lactoylglutathione lyase family enzyme
MITNVSLMGVWVTDIDEAKDFYTEKLGFEVREDVTMGDYRWLTVGHPDQPDLKINLQVPGPPLDAESAE